ncbi:hypothetical protein Ciccas_000467 [Cichlidogyrus casuarinus]|uniref:Uncharacterized protein n=1 Tax=Cichlidogyrus casuarinus TaxID=1844966 RepID=A0ABD2QN26_9PLAT
MTILTRVFRNRLLDQNTKDDQPCNMLNEVVSFACLAKDQPSAAIHFNSASSSNDEENVAPSSPERNFFETELKVNIPLKGLDSVKDQYLTPASLADNSTQSFCFTKYADMPSLQQLSASAPQTKPRFGESLLPSLVPGIRPEGNFAACAAFRSLDFANLKKHPVAPSQSLSFADLANKSEPVIGRVEQPVPSFGPSAHQVR